MTVISLNCRSESDQRAIREQLARILKSGPFQQSRRRQRFLEYIVTETLAGRGERLKGYNVAVEVFDRPETFDPALDPVVRIEAARLREKLREYYDADGQSDPIRIELPKGGYTPQIEFRQGSNGKAQDPVEAPIGETHAGERPSSVGSWWSRRGPWEIGLAALALILVLGTAGVWLARDYWVPAQEAKTKEASVAVPNVPAIAVLPFTNLSGDPKQDYFSDGLSEDIRPAGIIRPSTRQLI